MSSVAMEAMFIVRYLEVFAILLETLFLNQ
jgi:hypothetical protein